MPTQNMQGCVEKPDRVQAVLRNAFYPPEATAPTVLPKFHTWRKLTIGAHSGITKLLEEELESKGYWSGLKMWGVNPLRSPFFWVAREECSIELVKTTAKELGFAENAPLPNVFARGIQLGLWLCPPETGARLLLQPPDQPEDYAGILIAMNPIPTKDRGRCVCGASCYEGQSKLYAVPADMECEPDYELAFCK